MLPKDDMMRIGNRLLYRTLLLETHFAETSRFRSKKLNEVIVPIILGSVILISDRAHHENSEKSRASYSRPITGIR